MPGDLHTLPTDAPSLGIKEAYWAVVSEVEELKRQRKALDAKIEHANKARDELRKLLGISDSSEIAAGDARGRKRDKSDKKKSFHKGSQTSEVIIRTKAILLKEGRPLPRGDLLKRLSSDGFEVKASNPAKFVGRALWESDDFIHVENEGYWLAGQTLQVRTRGLEFPSNSES